MKLRTGQLGFTLIELLVVVAIIGILGAIGLSTVNSVVAGGSKAQARNTVDAQLRVARSLAIRDGRYTGVHFQRHYRRNDEYWLAIVQEMDPGQDPAGVVDQVERGNLNYDPDDPNPNAPGLLRFFSLPQGARPQKLPDGMGVGGGGLGTGFTTFTVVFAPDGRLVTSLGEIALRFVKPTARGRDTDYRYCSTVFADQEYVETDADDPAEHDDPLPQRDQWKIWSLPAYLEPQYVRAVRIFDTKDTTGLADDEMDSYLEDVRGYPPLAIGPYVGGLLIKR